MEFEHSEKVRKLQERVDAFMVEHIYPNEEELFAQVNEGDRWQPVPLLESLKARARAAELWNLFLPESQYGAGLTNLEYAPLCEIMGRSPWAPEVFNCSAPDTGNMEVLVRYGTVEQRERWLDPLLAGEIRSAFAMTEPDVASSDATNIETRIRRDANDYVINGRKWWTSGALDPRCKIMIVMGQSDPDNPDRYRRQSMILCRCPTRASSSSGCCRSLAMTRRRMATPKFFSTMSGSRPPICCSARDADSRSRRDGSVPGASTIVCGSSVWLSVRSNACAGAR
jgi:acyl-CoA dehydrogenase